MPKIFKPILSKICICSAICLMLSNFVSQFWQFWAKNLLSTVQRACLAQQFVLSAKQGLTRGCNSSPWTCLLVILGEQASFFSPEVLASVGLGRGLRRCCHWYDEWQHSQTHKCGQVGYTSSGFHVFGLETSHNLVSSSHSEEYVWSTARSVQAFLISSSLPELLEKKRLIDMHTNIATAMLEQIKVG